MRLLELSDAYRESEEALRGRMRELRRAVAVQPDPEQQRRLRRRIAQLQPLAREMRQLAVLTACYYEKGGCCHAGYRP